LDLILLLDERRKEIAGIPVQVVSPNWLTSGSSQPGSTGGPGGKPTPYSGDPENGDYEFSFEKFKASKLNSITELMDNRERGGGKGVTVAILDTAPQPDELDAIYDTWVVQGKRNHSLLSTLLDPHNRMLTVHADPRVTDPPLRDLQCIGYDYDMNDHGLFVAGIIHSLALQAQLHLYQVLNRYGVGDMEIIGDALQQIVDGLGDGSTMPLVVNLSLNFAIPLGHKHTREGRPTISDRIGSRILDHQDGSWLNRLKGMMVPFGDLLEALGPAVIAAAGNDYDVKLHGNQRPEARYPAAFDGVVGVGALPKYRPAGSSGITTASYSNIADRPAKSGITSLGGEEGEGNGVLGIYIGEFPKREGDLEAPPNTSGWAWWCGTSFATPIISGLVAAAASGVLGIAGTTAPASTTQAAINMVYDAQQSLTTAGEDVFFVPQS
jgi:subtilisin family serine protease